jgi:primase-polymerase (primpol)-like protein
VSASEATPGTLPVITEGIAHDLQVPNQWAAWRWEKRGGKWTKPPINPATGGYARNNDPDTWGSFETALWRMRKDRLPGVGFMFHPHDGLAGVDLDGCRDVRSGQIEPWALEIVGELDSYAEASPSGAGLKVFVRGDLPSGRRRKGAIEMYDRGRFFTTTGHHLAGVSATVNDRQAELTRLHRRVFGPEKKPRGEKLAAEVFSAGMDLSDSDLLVRAMHAANGEKFERLWAGDTREYATSDNEGRSEADLALCSLLAFWCGPDEERIDRLFRQSGLYRPKWERADYRTLTVSVALDREEFWNAERPRIKVYARREAVVRLG